MILEVGCGTNNFQFPYNDLHQLATQSIVKSTWEFILDNKLLICHDVNVLCPRIDDNPIIKLFYDKGARGETLLQLNKGRLFLKAFHMSDIVDFSGTCITENAWQDIAPITMTNNFDWPRQGKCVARYSPNYNDQ
jgi:hypothetical protein